MRFTLFAAVLSLQASSVLGRACGGSSSSSLIPWASTITVTTSISELASSTATSSVTGTTSAAIDTSSNEITAAIISTTVPLSTETTTSTLTNATPSTAVAITTPAMTTISSTATTTTAATSSPLPPNPYSGVASFFFQNGNAGSCGEFHNDNDLIAALAYGFDPVLNNPNNKYCGKQIHITNTQNGLSVVAKIADTCPTCATSTSLDLSRGAFDAIASESDGMVAVTWYFV
ncbi:RlpA-like double-psi beta-barrel-protein domain-containing protein-containing protein [Xylariales sp. PMI_506]|nr:RlpA-like double-psi beta-barrel-protein domain-containing protein-containing protein [Xylariales sp. PMI_506]